MPGVVRIFTAKIFPRKPIGGIVPDEPLLAMVMFIFMECPCIV